MVTATQTKFSKKRKDKGPDFSRSYFWYENNLSPILQESINSFWNIETEVSLFGINNKPDFLWKGYDFFVTQLRVFQDITIFIRTSDSIIKNFLDFSLGEKPDKNFKLNKISNLEGMLVSAFGEKIKTDIQEIFISREKLEKASLTDDWQNELLHFVFNTYIENEMGRIIISIPSKIIKKPELVEASDIIMPLEQFENSNISVNIEVGSTKVAIEDLKGIEPDDIILLDKSNINKIKIKNSFEIIANINPDPGLVVNLDNNEGGNIQVSEEITPTADMWDNIQVEVGAEFEKIKLTLGELRQISEGLVVDLAPVFKNKITLKVENSSVAEGELVIIDDKYGVRLTKVHRQEPPQEKEKIEEPMEDEDIDDLDKDLDDDEGDEDLDDDFDYSDFEMDDDI